jgi:hypothetical protein
MNQPCFCGARRSYRIFQHNVSSKTSKLASGPPHLNAKNEFSRDRSAMCFSSYIVWSLRVAYRKPPHIHTPLCMYKIICSCLPVSVAHSHSRGTTDVLRVFPTYL